jgi:aspartate racemase
MTAAAPRRRDTKMAAQLDSPRQRTRPGDDDGHTHVGPEDDPAGLLGVLGGLGPLASAEFLRTIYEHGLGAREQEAPRVVVYSDPTFPDRTEALLSGSEGELLERLTEALERLGRLGASRVVICCVTMHHLLPSLPRELRARVVSLLDVIFEEVLARREPHLLLCTTGARVLKIFERHELWPRAAGLFTLPDEEDQRDIHKMIYGIKQSQDARLHIPFVESLLRKYGVGSFIAGCTEIHLLTKQCAAGAGPRCLDPLTHIARGLAARAGSRR